MNPYRTEYNLQKIEFVILTVTDLGPIYKKFCCIKTKTLFQLRFSYIAIRSENFCFILKFLLEFLLLYIEAGHYYQQFGLWESLVLHFSLLNVVYVVFYGRFGFSGCSFTSTCMFNQYFVWENKGVEVEGGGFHFYDIILL